jgi:hypothetical protein
VSAVFASFNCRHERRELRRFTNANGHSAIHEQCLDCGARRGSAQRAAGNDGLPTADAGLGQQYDDAREAARVAVVVRYIDGSAKFLVERRAGYDEYLKTPQWRAKRAKVLERCGGLCEGCREKTAKEVHHLTYDHLFDELLFELVGVCADCHAKAHFEADEDDWGVEPAKGEPADSELEAEWE